MTSVRSALVDYSRSFSRDRASAADQSFVCSPLGAWLLLALVAPENPACASALGLEPQEAARLARELVDADHGDYRAALAAWSNRRFADDWLAVLPKHDSGPVPSARDLNQWAEERTEGLIDQFPDAERAARMESVLATAVVAKTLWQRPFNKVKTSWQGSYVDGLGRALIAEERGGVARTSAGEFAYADVRGEDGGYVLLVVGDEDQSPQTVIEAAYDVSDAIAGTGEAKLLGLDDLPLGQGHSWSISRAEKKETYLRTVPFELNASFDLGGTPGFKELSERGVAGLFSDGATLPVDSVLQTAMARFHAKGFEAAAVTAMMLRSAMMNPAQKRLNLEFSRPFAFLARDRDSLPWFSGWVAEPGRDSGD